MPDKYKFLVTTADTNNSSLKCSAGKVVKMTDDMLRSAMYYFAWKASLELKKFVDIRKYDHITEEIDIVMYYSGEQVMKRIRC